MATVDTHTPYLPRHRAETDILKEEPRELSRVRKTLYTTAVVASLLTAGASSEIIAYLHPDSVPTQEQQTDTVIRNALDVSEAFVEE